MQGSPIGPHQAKFVLNGEEYSRSLESLVENIHSILGEKSTRTSSREGSLLEAVESFSQSIAKVSEGLERVLDSRLVLYMNGDQRSAIDALIGDVRSLQQFMGELTQDAVPSILSEAILQLGSQCLHSLHRIPSEWITRSRRELDQIAAASDELQEFTGDQLLQELKRDALGITSSQSALGEVRGKAVPKWDDSKFFSGEVSLLSAVLLGLQKERKRNFGTIITRNPSRVYESLPIDGLVVAEPGADGMMVSSLERFLQRDCGGEGIQVQTYPHIDELPPLERDDVYIAIDRKDLMSHDGRVCLPMPRGYRVVAISLIDGEGEKIPTNPQVLSALQLTASVSQELQFHKVEYVLAPVDDRPCYATLIERLPQLLPALPHHPQENLRQALTEAAKIEDLSARQNAIANIEEASGLIYQNSTELREIYRCSGPNFLAVAEGGVGSCWELSHRLIHRMNALGAGPAIMAVAPTFTTDCKSFRRPGHCAALLLGQEGEMRVFDPTYWADSRRALFLTLMTIEEWEFAEEQLSSVDPEQAREFICSLRDKYEDSYQNAIGEAVVVHGEGHQFKHDYQAKSWEELLEETPRGRLLYGFAAKDESLLMRVNTDPDASQFVKHLAAQCLAMFAKRPEFPRTPSILNYLADPYAGCREGDTPYVPVAVLRGCFKDACFEDVEDSALSSLLERTVGCALRRGQHVDPIEFYPAISTLLSRGVDVALEDESDPIRLTLIVKLIGYMKEVASGHGPTSMALQSEFARDLKAYFEAAGHSPKSLVLAGMNKGSGLKVEETEYLLSCFARIGEYEEEIVASDEGFDFTEETKQQLRGQLCSRICKAVRKNDFLELNGIHWEFFRDRVGLSEDFTEQVEEEILDVIDSRQNPALPSNPMTYLATNEMSEALPSAMHFWQNVLQTLKDEGVVSERFLESISRPEREPREVWKVCGDRDSHEFVAEILGGSSGESSAMIMSEKYFKDGEERTAEMMNLRTVPLVVLRDLAQLHDEVVINRFSRLEREFGELKPSSADETMEEVFSRWKEGFPEDFEELIWLFPEETSESMLAAIHREFLKRLKQPHSLSSCEMALASRYAESSDGDAFRNLYQSATTKIAERFDAGDKRGTEEAIYDFRRKFFDERFLPMDSRDSLLLYALSVPEPKTFSHWREKAGIFKGERLSRKQVLIKLMDIVGASSDEWFVDQVWGSIQKLSSKGGDRQLEAVGTRFPRATQDKARNSPPASTGSFESFAEYLPGSHSFRQIDWRASAKRDSLVVQHKKDGDSVKVEVQLDLSATRDWRFGNRSGYVRILQELREQILAHKVPTLVLSVAGTTVKEFSARELKAALFGHSIEGESPPRAFATLLQEFESYVIGFSRLSVVLPTQRLHAQFQPGGIRADGSNRVVSFYCDSSDKDSIERTLLSAKKRLGISGYVTAI